jgi:prepilin-type N-terminal cleavage/methylation domain-containing protein
MRVRRIVRFPGKRREPRVEDLGKEAGLTVRQRSSTGFSLIELLVVIAIGLVLTGMAIPMTLNAVRSYQLTAATSAATGAIQTTRYQAIMHGYSYEITFTPGSNTYQVFSMIPPANTYTAYATVGTTTLPTSPIPLSGSNVSISRTVTFQFAAGGTVTETTGTPYFWITNPWGGSNKITVSGVGNVSVSSP